VAQDPSWKLNPPRVDRRKNQGVKSNALGFGESPWRTEKKKKPHPDEDMREEKTQGNVYTGTVG